MLRPHRLVLRAAAALAVLVTCLLPLSASADTGQIDVQLGGMQLQTDAGSTWHPTVRLAGSVTLVGPLQAGAFVNITADHLPLRQPHLGGGAFAALRPSIGPLRLIGEGSVARLRLPVSQTEGEGAWVFAATAGLGVALGDRVHLEGRLSHQWLRGGDELGHTRGWTVLGGLSFSL